MLNVKIDFLQNMLCSVSISKPSDKNHNFFLKEYLYIFNSALRKI